MDCDMENNSKNNSDTGVPEDSTAEWVNTLDDTSMWMDQFTQRHDSISGDIMSGAYILDSDALMALDNKPSSITPDALLAPKPIDPTPWSDLIFNPEMIPGTEDMDPSYSFNNGFLGDALSDTTPGNSGSTSRADGYITADGARVPIERSVGRVTLVIDGCNRDTLHDLLDLTKSLKGKSKIEID
ncbi:hypothetical protein F5X97DRAFT_301369 [Nemania serpens]|nr:hypothetical protein F5X97DRAFT_301369 [Nemania serpens]